MSSLFKVGTINNISRVGLKRFPKNIYQLGALDEEKPMEAPMGILLRSHKLQSDQVDKSVSAIVRCGAGTNNIPVNEMTGRGIPVFNTPGANANAVKELVLCSLFLSARNITGGIKHVQKLTDEEGFDVAGGRVEQDKKLFAGTEIKGKTIGIIGLGAIGAKVAMAASNLGMKVLGYDPALSIESAWSLDGNKVSRVNEIETIAAASDYISLHLPVIKGVTEGIVGEQFLSMMKPTASLLNFSRGELVDHEALRAVMDQGKFEGMYCTDFPNKHVQGHDRCIAIPHLGASTEEAEENSAAIAADTLRDFLENGTIKNSVNFPTTLLKRRKNDATRIAIVNENTSGMLMKINNLLYEAGLNVDQQINTSRDKISYNVIDIDEVVGMDDFTPLHNQLESIEGIKSVRILAGDDRDHHSYRASVFPRQLSRI